MRGQQERCKSRPGKSENSNDTGCVRASRITHHQWSCARCVRSTGPAGKKKKKRRANIDSLPSIRLRALSTFSTFETEALAPTACRRAATRTIPGRTWFRVYFYSKECPFQNSPHFSLSLLFSNRKPGTFIWAVFTRTGGARASCKQHTGDHLPPQFHTLILYPTGVYQLRRM